MPKVVFINSNLPECRYRIFRKKEELDEPPDDSTDIFQRNMLDRYTDRPDSHFQNGKYAILENLCFAEFISYYYVESKINETSNYNDSQPVVLTLYAPTPQSGQTNSNNSSAKADELFECV